MNQKSTEKAADKAIDALMQRQQERRVEMSHVPNLETLTVVDREYPLNEMFMKISELIAYAVLLQIIAIGFLIYLRYKSYPSYRLLNDSAGNALFYSSQLFVQRDYILICVKLILGFKFTK